MVLETCNITGHHSTAWKHCKRKQCMTPSKQQSAKFLVSTNEFLHCVSPCLREPWHCN
uniref:Uncharacterized protein n=1 Tax=Anguilla anguilla TaxID=7936 RepID=A0A0E9PTE3_ANGAN